MLDEIRKMMELKHIYCKNVKKLNLNIIFYEIELSNGEFILMNTYTYDGSYINDVNDYDNISWCVYKESVIDRVNDDTLWENVDEYYSEDFKLLLEDMRVLRKEVLCVVNEYIDIINKYC
jgi:hypothetical protein